MDRVQMIHDEANKENVNKSEALKSIRVCCIIFILAAFL